jgi:hypothetical protein
MNPAFFHDKGILTICKRVDHRFSLGRISVIEKGSRSAEPELSKSQTA